MQIGIDSFATRIRGSGAVLTPADRVRDLLEEAEATVHAGVDVFGIREQHREEFIESADPRFRRVIEQGAGQHQEVLLLAKQLRLGGAGRARSSRHDD